MTVKPLFVTGTGTDVGKTVVSRYLTRSLPGAVHYWKPVQSGRPYDSAVIAEDSNVNIIDSLIVYETPASPDQAAIRDGLGYTSVQDIKAAYQQIDASCDGWLIIEAAGGLIVPINEQETWIDLLSDVQWPCLVVGASGLGTLNHSCLTLRELSRNNIAPLGLILSGARHLDNEKSLGRILGTTPWYLDETDGQSRSDDNPLTNALVERYTQREQADSTRLIRDDRKHVWHPFTQHATAGEPLCIESARGSWLKTCEGEELIDGISSWWVNTVGHGRPEIGDAIARQQQRLDHVVFAGATHRPGIEFARRLVKMMDSPLQRVFYSDNGSTAVEVGFKMAFQSWVNRGDTSRTKFLCFRGGYHGDTVGAMSLAASGQFHNAFSPLFFETLMASPLTSHRSYICPDGLDDADTRIEELRRCFAENHRDLAGVMVEPLIQGAGGMLVQSQAWLRELATLCKRYEIPLILDEVFSGMGRCGASAAFKRADIEPDIICLAKGLTGGTMPLAVTMATESIFNSFLSENKSEAFLHGHSYTGNPIGCAAGLATLDIYYQEGLCDRAQAMELSFLNWIESKSASLNLQNPRALGAILAFELPGSEFGDYFSPASAHIAPAARQEGLFLRPLGNTVYLAPPLSTNDRDLGKALASVETVLLRVKDMR